jgi:hypothetical protein
MGWTSSPSWTTKAKLVAELRSQVRSYVIVDEHIGRNVWFLLEQPSGERFIVLFLTEGGAGGWAYKDVTEDMGPCEVDCPLRLIEAAGPIESQYANEWRDRVRAYWQTKVARMAQVIEPGVKVTVYGKPYTVIKPADTGRSWIIENPAGQRYKTSKAKMVVVPSVVSE